MNEIAMQNCENFQLAKDSKGKSGINTALDRLAFSPSYGLQNCLA